MSGQLSRSQMKAITGGRPYPGDDDANCSACTCEGGARALPANDGPGGGICYCPDDSRICCPGDSCGEVNY